MSVEGTFKVILADSPGGSFDSTRNPAGTYILETVYPFNTIAFRAIPDSGYTFTRWMLETDAQSDGVFESRVELAPPSTQSDSFSSYSANRTYRISAVYTAAAVTPPPVTPPPVTPPPVTPPPEPLWDLVDTYKGINIYYSGYTYKFTYLNVDYTASSYTAIVVKIEEVLGFTPPPPPPVNNVDVVVETYREIPIYLSYTTQLYYVTVQGKSYMGLADVGEAKNLIDDVLGGVAPPPVTPPPVTPPAGSIIDRFIGFKELPTVQRLMVGGLVFGGMAALFKASFPAKKIREAVKD